jgi:hypothetical protein
MGRCTRVAVGVATASLPFFAFGTGRAGAAEDSGIATVTFSTAGGELTCTIQGRSSVASSADRSTMRASTALVDAFSDPGCEQAIIQVSAEATYVRKGESEAEFFGATAPRTGVEAVVSTSGVVISMDVTHEVLFDTDEEPGRVHARLTTSPK